MLQGFRTYQMALELYRMCKGVSLPFAIKDQLLRASSSVALNLAEGSAKPSVKERRRFYRIALGSLREIQAIIDLEGEKLPELPKIADHLGACIYRLCTN